MRKGEGLILSVLLIMAAGIAFVMAGRIYKLKQEQDTFAELRGYVKEQRNQFGTAAGPGEMYEPKEKNPPEENETKREILPEYQSLHDKNPDFAGWVSIEGTRIDYPVMQRLSDREYYLHRDFSGELSYAGVPFSGHGNLNGGAGAVFLYGHNMKSGSMFADLLKYEKKEFWEKNPEIILDTLYEHRKYTILASFYVEAKEWENRESPLYALAYGKTDEKTACLQELKRMALYDTEMEISEKSEVLILVTCSYQKSDQRFVVAGISVLDES